MSRLLIKKELLGIVIMSILFGFIYTLSYKLIFLDTKIPIEDKINQYASSDFDYILTDMTQTQYGDLKDNVDIEHSSPIYMFDDVPFNFHASLNIMVFESPDDLAISFFNDQRIVKKSAMPVERPMFITYDLAQTYNLSLGDKVQLLFGTEQTIFEFQIETIFQNSNVFGQDYQIALINFDAFMDAYQQDLFYNAVFIETKTSAFDQYVESYIPMANAPQRSSFSTEERYLEEMELFLQRDFSNHVLDKALKVEQLSNTYESTLNQKSFYRMIIIGTMYMLFFLYAILQHTRIQKTFKSLFLYGMSFNQYLTYITMASFTAVSLFLVTSYLSMSSLISISVFYVPTNAFNDFIIQGLLASLIYPVVSLFLAMIKKDKLI